MFNILVLEDNDLQRKNLVRILEQSGDIYNIIEASCIKEGYKIARDERIDLFYVDVNLAEDSGLTFALEIRKMDRYKLTWIVFLTNYVEHMLEAFKKVHCYDYIIKPYDKKTIFEITRLLSLQQPLNPSSSISERKHIIVSAKGIDCKIFIDEIYFIEVYLHTCIIHTFNGKYRVERLSLKKLTSMLDTDKILQSHRAYFVNMDHIKSIENTPNSAKIYFIDYDEPALLGRNYKRNILLQFQNRERDRS